jgi:hypothetical protein
MVHVGGPEAKSKHKIFFFVFVFLVVAVLIFTVVRKNEHNQAKYITSPELTSRCKDDVKNIDKSTGSNAANVAAKIAESDIKTCTNVADKAARFDYYSRLAETTYGKGDKEKAKEYADRALMLSNSLSKSDIQHVENYDIILLHLKAISAKNYTDFGGIN